MSLKIAFCGPNMELCRDLAAVARDRLYNSALDIVEIPNTLAEVMELTGRTRFDGPDLDWMNLWVSDLRRMHMERVEQSDIVISASCGIDQACLQATWVGDQLNNFGTGLVMADAQGNEVYEQHQALVNRSGAVLQTLLNSSEEEVVEYWDFVYAVMPVSANLSALANNFANGNAVLVQYEDFLSTVPAYVQNVDKLPDNKEAALDLLDKETDRWTAKLNAG